MLVYWRVNSFKALKKIAPKVIAQGNAGPDNIHTIWAGTGTVQTLDESPPEFTTLTVKDAGFWAVGLAFFCCGS